MLGYFSLSKRSPESPFAHHIQNMNFLKNELYSLSLVETSESPDSPDSFLEREREMINEFNIYTPVQPVMDIFLEYRISEKPTPHNIKQLVVKAATMALIRGPSFG